jgi:protein-S-isoprenylcysteine O-methyltransferase Ste14
MNDLNKKAFEGLTFFILALAVLLFLPVWTFHYWQAWVFLSVFSVSVFLITVYLMKKDTKLLERRVNAGSAHEKEKSQKVIQFVAQFAFIAVVVFPSIDHRFGWSTVPAYICIIGDMLVALGLFVVFLVFRKNTFTSATIEVASDQKVISTGPYAFVRHPMYSGAIIMLLGVPLALGSWWGLLAVIPITFVMIWRLLDEEKFLSRDLPGYIEYCAKVRWHLVPGIF